MSGNRPKNYWRSLDEITTAPAISDVAQAIEEAPGRFSRRSFLRAAGFTTALAAAAGCSKAPVEKALPLLTQPENRVAGRAQFYATTCGACEAGCGALVKCRDGRPIKLEGNPEHPLNAGGLCAAGQAALLGLYDSHRFAGPQRAGASITWADADAAIIKDLSALRTAGGGVRLLTATVTSPTLQNAIEQFLSGFSDARHITCNTLSHSAILDAHEATHGARVLPRYRFDKAAVIVSFDADFLGTWISPVEFAAGYRQNRQVEQNPEQFSYHAQFESRLSLTGSRADHRYRVAPDELGLVLETLTARILGQPAAGQGLAVPEAVLEDLAARLTAARGKSLVLCGSQDVAVQQRCNTLNQLLESYGNTIELEAPSYQHQGDDAAVFALLEEMQQGHVASLIIAGVNPVYDLPEGPAFAAALAKTGLVVYCGERPNETSRCAQYVCPDHHFLEAWGDAEAVSGVVALRQPVIRPLFDTRPLLESLNTWSGAPRPAYESIQAYWQQHIYPRSQDGTPFLSFWDRTLHDGWARVSPRPAPAVAYRDTPPPAIPPAGGEELTLVLYPKIGLLDGRHAYNPWLQELPDPISKITWDNYACLSVATAQRLGLAQGDVIRMEAEGVEKPLELPVCLQPAQHDRVIAVALGYGQESTARFTDLGPQWLQSKPSVGEDGLVGKRAASFLAREQGRLRFERGGVKLTRTGKSLELACTQTHHTITVPEHLAPAGGLRRDILQETTLVAFRKDPHAGSHGGHEYRPLYPLDHPKGGHRWGMAIDLSTCTGCSACVVACQAENNIPVVGKDEVRRRREMHWLRIDRYYSGEGDNVDVAYQPMLCQQCENASCENVCPVLATVHTSEGLNAQVYNRCVGTRYCANNCAYKVRRFNWFRYHHDDPVENLVLNPDVTVRSRGIMEKCTFCVQRIQEAKIESKRRKEPVADGAIQPACQQSCPMQAITFGDLNDPESRVSKLMQSPRHYRVLEEIDVRPSVGYLTLVRHRTEEEEVEHHG
ncbi:MAG: 4Fe-4S dicluster domain-containing protein [Candidatus Hydrogenedentes bacterium]|nr:4Fe-4S dicluster domain-containing protein [Candidatus Hydrogenedentota bacterium]